MFTNIRLLLEACNSLNLDYEIVHPNENVIQVNLDKPYLFVNGFTPILTGAILKVVKDKDYTYHLLKDRVLMPKTVAYVDPYVSTYENYAIHKSIPEIVAAIEETFSLPVIVKKNTGSGGENVFLCDKKAQIEESLQTIFNLHDKDYDYMALAQEVIEIEREYRAIFLNKSLVLLYEKNIQNATFTGNLSPLHWDGAQAIHVTDEDTINKLEEFIQPIFERLPIDYGGFDIAVDQSGALWLIEINSNPNYKIFIRDNPEKLAVEVFEKLLKSLMKSH
ncbi:MAG: alpha-L-glutamate ligase [Roseofilum sp. SBFL]|uniref:ATP-grasp domain-containing protein n=1 Tax=unclassified Roseofilum TaxID=2620099 RepID=UPI001B2A4CA8|nr:MULTISPECIES: YheC/YheD family protein [unclassified Roseofilum]MBP0015906.1 alpha-L-glutamate ligase [Roseofilum sp. SID3]MBP0023777.1 alpha-L-glutamate ligase [Roseofilum sp. SID2]MBP0038920.1 alpha-L-glutamate ligase [Roseofilum sp. SID1]MBP0043730.1 alpha-L-glutamate ligase [Roseofilum sp. SBFL]